MVDGAMGDTRARDESAQRTKFLIDAVHRVSKPEPFAVSHERGVPERRVAHDTARLVVALRELE
jgi:hypothetical protein